MYNGNVLNPGVIYRWHIRHTESYILINLKGQNAYLFRIFMLAWPSQTEKVFASKLDSTLRSSFRER